MSLTVREMDTVIQTYCDEQRACNANGGCILRALCDEVDGNFESSPKTCEKAYKKVMEFRAKSSENSMELCDNEAGKPDMVNHPPHYTNGGMECIDEMIMLFGKEAVMNFCVCNAWKYRKRAIYKNGEEDMKKSDWYLNKYKELKDGTVTISI